MSLVPVALQHQHHHSASHDRDGEQAEQLGGVMNNLDHRHQDEPTEAMTISFLCHGASFWLWVGWPLAGAGPFDLDPGLVDPVIDLSDTTAGADGDETQTGTDREALHVFLGNGLTICKS